MPEILREQGQPAISQSDLEQFRLVERAYLECREELERGARIGIEMGALHVNRDALLHVPRKVVSEECLAPRIDLVGFSPMATLLLEDYSTTTLSIWGRGTLRFSRFRLFRFYYKLMRRKASSLTRARTRALRCGTEISLAAIASQHTEMRRLLHKLGGISWLYLAGFSCGQIAQKCTKRLFAIMRGGPVIL